MNHRMERQDRVKREVQEEEVVENGLQTKGEQPVRFTSS